MFQRCAKFLGIYCNLYGLKLLLWLTSCFVGFPFLDFHSIHFFFLSWVGILEDEESRKMKIGHSAEELSLVFAHIYAKQQVDKIINYLKFNKLYRYVLVYFFFKLTLNGSDAVGFGSAGIWNSRSPIRFSLQRRLFWWIRPWNKTGFIIPKV